MKFKVGDKVRIREDLKEGSAYGVYCGFGMADHAGKKTDITGITEKGNYKLAIDKSSYNWSADMLEAVEQPFNNPIEFGGLSIHKREGGGMAIFKTDPSDEWEEYEDINHRLIRELKNYADAGVISPEDYQKQVDYLAMEKALNKPDESNSRIYTTVTDSVNHPAHYNVGGIETIDVIRAMLTPEEYRGYLKGNVLKYRERAPYKHETPDEDHAKAKVYWELLREAEGERIFE